MSNPILFNSSEIAELINDLSETICENYVFPEVGAQISEVLKRRLASGIYSEIDDCEKFAATLTKHIQEGNNDKHLRVWYKPEEATPSDQKTKQNSAIERQSEYDLAARLNNFGFSKVEVLEGNIGYIDIRQFYPVADAANTGSSAMNFVSNTDALIFDLRKCIGGAPDMVSFICTYLFEEQVHLNDLYLRESDSTQQYWTLPYVPGSRYIQKPVFILTSQDTFSAGEEFCNDLKETKRATLVGESTKGGAHPGRAIRFHKNFQVFVARGRAINPTSKSNWEGCGVIPHIESTREDAFPKAYKIALERVLETIGEHEPKGHELQRSQIIQKLENLA